MTQHYDHQTIEKSLDDAVAFVLAQAEYHCPPEDGRAEWDPEEFELAEQIMRERWPVRVPVVYEMFFDGNVIQMRSRALTEPWPGGLRLDIAAAPFGNPPRTVPEEYAGYRRAFRALFPCDRETLGNALALVLHRDAQRGIADLSPLMMLAATQPELFLPIATDYFVELSAASATDLATCGGLRYLVLVLEARMAGAIVKLVAQTTAVDDVAGRCLREAILRTLEDPYVCDGLGWLRAGELIEALELV